MLQQSKQFFTGYVLWRTLLFCLFLSFLSPCKALSGTVDEEALEAASSFKEWSVLLHYQQGVFGKRSLVDDPLFFLDKNGKYDLLAELKALYHNIYTQELRGGGSAVCRFPLRAEFLAKSLGRPTAELNFEECDELQDFMNTVNPVKASIIFPFYHMNGPASMFGHTLLRFDSDLESRLVSTAVTYAADYNGRDGGITYALKGLTGLYAGRSEIIQYHKKIREYDNINQRDIWEYELNLTPDEVRKMVLHTYEIKDTWSRYFFFDENCAYNLLFIIEAARPDTELTDGFLWVIPADTVYVLKEKDLLGEAVFRPSQSTRMAEMLKEMDKEIYELAVESISKKELKLPESLTDEEKVRLLDFWIEYTQFSNRKNNVNEYSEELIKVLRQRAAIPIRKTYETHVPENPINGHRPSKLTLTTGMNDGRLFGEVRWRPALHTPDDSDVGFLEGSTLAFFDITVRKEEEENFILKKLSFVDIYSLAPVTEIFNPVSWKVNFGLEHLDKENSTAAFFNPGAGKTLKLGGGLAYGLVVTKLRASTGYDEGFSAGVGYEVGYTAAIGNSKVRLSNDIIRYGLGKDKTEGSLKADLHYFLTRNLSLTVGVKKDLYDDRDTEAYVSIGINH